MVADGRRAASLPGCRAETSVTTGTIFAGTRTPLAGWFAAVRYVLNQKQGVSALGLQRVVGLGSDHTAWAWLHKLRRAMVLAGRELAAVRSRSTRATSGQAAGLRRSWRRW